MTRWISAPTGFAALLVGLASSCARPNAESAPPAPFTFTVKPAMPQAAHAPSASAPAPAPPARPSHADIAERARASIVVVRAGDRIGTGFFIARGKVATCLHVVEGAEEISVQMHHGGSAQVSLVEAYDRVNDLVVLHVDANMPALLVASSDHVRPGDDVLVIGHPLGLESTVSTGVVSAIRTLESGLELLQITAPISPGSSGGPVLDARGAVIGVSRMLLTSGQALNFATPSERIGRLLGNEGSPLTLTEFARMTRPRGEAPANAALPAPAPPSSPSLRSRPAPPTPDLPAFPNVVAGFPFRATPRDVLALCPDLQMATPTLGWCPYTRVPLDFAKAPIVFTFSDSQTVAISLEPGPRALVEAALSAKYGRPGAVEWKGDGWTDAKTWRGGPGGALEWETAGGFIRYGRDPRNRAFLTFVSESRFTIQEQNY